MERVYFVSISGILALSFSIQVQGNAECFNYRFLNESDRAKTFTARKQKCDIKVSGWYRFGGNAGNRMASSCVPMYSCGTNQAGWLSGSHPAEADGIVQSKVCFSWTSDCCHSSIDISVRNCGGFYVYKLKRPSVCYSRYCGDGLANVLVIIPSGSTSVSSTLTSQTTAAPFLFPQYPPDDAFFLVKSSLVETVQASAVQVKEGKPVGSTSLLTTLTTQTTAAPFLSSLHTSNNGSFPVKSSLVQAVQPSAVQVNDASECPPEKLEGVSWSATVAGRTDLKPCPNGARGTAWRKCSHEGAWGNINFMDCSSAEFNKLSHQMNVIVGGFQSELNAEQVLSQLTNTTQPIKNSLVRPPQIYGGDLVIAVKILVQIAEYNGYQGNVSSTEDFDNYAQVASNLLDPVNSRTWKELEKSRQNSSQILVKAMDDYGMGVAVTFNRSTKSKVARTKNLMMRIDRLDRDFSLRSKGKGLKIEYNESSIYLPTEAFSSSQDSRVVTVVYLTLNDVLLLAKEREHEDGQALSAKTTIVSTTVYPRSPEVLSEPVKIVVQNKKMRISSDGTLQRKCVFWRPEESATWKTSGCRLVPSESDVTMTTCECDHLTIFAALMDPYGSTGNKDDKEALDIISTVGCSISLLAVLITIIACSLLVKPINTRVKVLLNLCAAIAITCAIAIFEGLARNKASCPVVAALLHYFLLTVFTWMLCEGVLHYIMIVLPFGLEADAEDKMKYFYLFGWGFPAIVVTISLAVTQTNGYGNTTACWLDVESGLIWAFIAPALAVILINVVVFILVIRRMTKPEKKIKKDKTRISKLRAGVKASVVILPLLGITWLFGLLSFSSDTIAFKYIFTIFNSLQGLMIFIFHCARKIKEAIKRRLERGNKRNLTNPDNRPTPNLKVQVRGGKTLSKATKRRSRGAENEDEELQETKGTTELSPLTNQEDIICDIEDAPLTVK